MHTPVLLEEVIEGLNIRRDGLYIDATAGEGGHVIEIAKLGGKVLGIDRDQKQIENLKLKIKNLTNVQLVQGNFANIAEIARTNSFIPVDGILMDLGLSMNQIQNSGKGFSYRNLEDPLDMRLDNLGTESASDLLNSLGQAELYELFSKYSEEINSLEISKSVVRARTLKKMDKVKDLINVIDRTVSGNNKKTYSRIFQALRIAVNNELEVIKKGLDGSLHILKKGGRIVIISFHSLEDRVVKRFINNHQLVQLNKKIITSKNRHAFERSAKLRIIQYEKSN